MDNKPQYVLKKCQFIYKDGKKYRFSVYEHEKLRFIDNVQHSILLERQRAVTINMLVFKKTFTWFEEIKTNETIMISIPENETLRSIKNRIISKIIDVFECIENEKEPKQTRLEKIFDDFDGYIAVSESQKDILERMNTIKDIIK